MDLLTQRKIRLPLAGLLVASLAGIYAILYAPTASQLQREGARAALAEKEVSSARAAIASYKTPEAEGLERRLLEEDEASEVIQELAKAAQSQEVKLISISPGQPTSSGQDYKTQTLEIEAESTFQNLGIFLGGLEKLPKGIFTVKGWDAYPESKDAALKLKSRLTLELYLVDAQKNASTPPVAELAAPQRTAKKSRSENWGSNPFVPKKAASPEALPGLVLNGILYDKTRPAAILNDRIVKTGDEVGPYKVVAINPEEVLVSDGSSEAHLRLDVARNAE